MTLTDKFEYKINNREVNDWKRFASTHRPDIIAARRQKDSRDALYRGAKISSLPDLFLEGRHSSLDPSRGGTSLKVGITMPILDLGKARSDTRSAQAAANEQVSLIHEIERQIDLDIETNYRNLLQTRKAVESFQKGRIDRSKQLLEMAQVGYQKGASSYLELLDAQQIYRSEQTDYLRALSAYNIAAASLERAAGGPLP